MIRVRPAVLLALAFALGTPLAAQQAITPDAFLERHLGKTLRFRSEAGIEYGREYWLSVDRTVWEDAEGCSVCDVLRLGGRLCFACDSGSTTCWRHFEEPDGAIWIESDQGTQAIGRIVDGPRPSCVPVPLS